MKLSEMLSPRPSSMWHLIRQSGVNNVVALLRGAEQEQRTFPSAASRGSEKDRTDVAPWSFDAIRNDQQVFADNGFAVVAVEDTPPMDLIRLGADGRDEQIDQFITQIRAMGKLGIPLLSYNWMAISCWTRTDVAAVARAGATDQAGDGGFGGGLQPVPPGRSGHRRWSRRPDRAVGGVRRWRLTTASSRAPRRPATAMSRMS